MDTLNILYMALVILIIIIYLTAFKNGKPTCNNYILNNYLYLILSLLLFVIFIINLQKTNINIFNNTLIHILYIIFILFIVILLSRPSSKFIYKHSILILFILLLSLSSSLVYKYIDKDQFIKICIQLGIILLFMTILALQFPSFFKDKYLPYIIFGLFMIIVSHLIDAIFYKNEHQKNISYISVVIFSLLMVYDTKKIMFSKLCNPVDYTSTTAGLFLDIINMFQNLYILDN